MTLEGGGGKDGRLVSDALWVVVSRAVRQQGAARVGSGDDGLRKASATKSCRPQQGLPRRREMVFHALVSAAALGTSRAAAGEGDEEGGSRSRIGTRVPTEALRTLSRVPRAPQPEDLIGPRRPKGRQPSGW